MSAPRPDRWVARSPDVLERRCGDVVLLLQRGTDELRRLEGVAAATWLVAAEPIRVDDLVDGAISAAGPAADPTTVAANVGGAVEALQRVGVLTVGDAPEPTRRARS